jgi:putative peptidoglycan lipid II flippase
MNKIWKSSAGFSFFTLISRIFGYLRDLVLTSFLGASSAHDIFVVVFRIPNVFRSFFGEGALAQSLVPSIIEAKENLNSFLNQVFTLLFITLISFVLFAEVFPGFFISLFAPGFYEDPDKLKTASDFLRLVFPYILLISFTAFFGAVQNSKKIFQVVAATPIIFNITLILFALFSKEFNLDILGISILTAGLIQLGINILVVFYFNYFPKLVINFDKKVLRSFFNKFIPAFFAAGIYQLNVLVDTVFASFLITGSPTWLYLSERLIQFPLGLFGVAVALVALPNITELFIEKKMDELRLHSIKLLRVLFLLGLAFVLGAFLFGELAIKILFLRGEFTSFDVGMTFIALQGYAFSMLFILPQKFFNSIFFAISKTNMVVVTGLISLVSNIILNYYFIYQLDYGHFGLALATSISSGIIFLISFAWLINQGIFKSI